MIGRRLAWGFGSLLILVLCLAGGALAYLRLADLRPYVERYASASLGRPLSISQLDIHWGNPLEVTVQGLALANAAWGSRPEMVTIRKVKAVLDPRSILSGPLRFHTLAIDGLSVVLERNPDGVGNWRMGDDRSAAPGDDQDRRKRELFPTLIDFALTDSLVTYRTYSGNILKIGLATVTIASIDDDQPANLTADGAYNETPLTLTAITQSFQVMRDADKPFGAKFTLATKTDKAKAALIAFDGTMMQPLDFDGVAGALDLDAHDLGALMKIFGAQMTAPYPLQVKGHLTHNDNEWDLTDAKGKLVADPFSGTLHVLEGDRGKPDHLGLNLAFDRLNLAKLVGAADGGSSDPFQAPLSPVEKGGTEITAALTANRLDFKSLHLGAVDFAGGIADGRVDVEHLSLALYGGRAELAGKTGPSKAGARVTLNVSLIDLDADRLAQGIGAGAGQIRGKLNGRGHLELTGKTLQEGLAGADGYAVLVMTAGSVERGLIEKASADLRTLLRDNMGSAQLDCLLGVLILKDGQGIIAPVKLLSEAGDFLGAGSVDLATRQLDLTLKAQRSSTGFFALDIPVRIEGKFDQLQVKPAIGEEVDWLAEVGDAAPIGQLPAPARKLANASSCGK